MYRLASQDIAFLTHQLIQSHVLKRTAISLMNQGTNSVSSMSNRYETGHSWVRGLRNGPTCGGLSYRTDVMNEIPFGRCPDLLRGSTQKS